MIQLSQEILQSVSKPARYTGGEFNAVKKNLDEVDCKFALALPDVYEVGMSNLGLAILYSILNSRQDTACERVYAPWIDMENLMRDRKIPLFTLESREPVKNFDLFGFSLQYEMILTNVLNMLDLAGIPIHSKDRTIEDPFIIGGGPCVYNVEPVAEFFDFFVVGEGEEILGEVVEHYINWKESGSNDRKKFLESLLNIDGIYVPSFYEPSYIDGKFFRLDPIHPKAPLKILKRIVKDMDSVSSVENPIVPYLDIVHNRIMLELFRGCSRGCRFCQAGICYRPVRERSESNLRQMARRLIDSSGQDSISLTSLSSADYSCLPRLIDDLMEEFRSEKISLSLPSLRIDSFSIELAKKIRQVRKSGLTFAPEAGTQRLRDVINKNVTESNLLDACESAFRNGWQQVKLYFMMGLPTETNEDVRGIAHLAKKVVDKYFEIKRNRRVKVTISVACFVPKPFTPFQWFDQIPLEEFERRQKLLKDEIRDRSIIFNYHDARLSTLEGSIARGDRRMSQVIETAWKLGAKFDGWSDLFKYDLWIRAFEECGIDLKTHFDFEDSLPWEHTTPGVSREFLLREWKKSQNAKTTSDCRRGVCQGCEICPNLNAKVIDHFGESIPSKLKKSPAEDISSGRFVYRARISKGESISVLGHLDFMNLIMKSIQRSKLPIMYSEGFHPHMRLSLATALGVGITSDAEYMEFILTQRIEPEIVRENLNESSPNSLKILEVKLIDGKMKSLTELANRSKFEIRVPILDSGIEKSISEFNRAPEVLIDRVTPKNRKTIDLKKFLESKIEFEICDSELILRFEVKISPVDGSIKPMEVIRALKDQFALPIRIEDSRIHRLNLTRDGIDLLECES
ncbi:MAG: TIGR03960 family B12-binding radical SAM protein [Selenomonadaceae bacterium]|nr:TIGR03960 family B12-binding radical SAM protein [Selenomonadaceae bacterium]